MRVGVGALEALAIIKSRLCRRKAAKVGVPVGHGYNYFLACDTAERIIFAVVAGSGSGKLCWHSRGNDNDQENAGYVGESAGGSEEKQDIPQLAAAVPQRAASGNRIALRTNVPTTSRTNAQAVQPERIQPLSELIGSEPQLIAPTSEPIALAALKTGAEISGTPGAKTQAGAEKSAEPKKFNLISLFAPFDPIIPIKTYRTENEHGIEIASILRIGNKIQKTEAHD